MASTPFTYEQERDGAVAEFLSANPEHRRRNWPTHVEILTGEDMLEPVEVPSGESN